ncbi:MAG: hypothetical protein LPK48_10320, partial [Bacteroidota bacterium]|nr:hypothetical protein [Bacteroidota bacterium]
MDNGMSVTGMMGAFMAIAPLDKPSLESLNTIIHRRELPKGSTLLKLGQVDRQMHFMVSGSGRV